jgi:anthranilate synthase component 2
MILMIDNYDSFTYNIVQYLGELGELVEVFRNDEISLAEIDAMAPQGIVISPGPCTPNEAGISMEVIRAFAGKIPILGICLGHQSIGQVYGGVVGRAKKVMHGKTSAIHHTGLGVFAGLPNPFTATRYHSLVVESDSLPDCLEVTAWTLVDGVIDEIMGVKHKSLLIEGVQFHPESILTEHGHDLLQSFVDTCAQSDSSPSAQTTQAPAKLMEDSR